MRRDLRLGAAILFSLAAAFLGTSPPAASQSPTAHPVDQRQACLACHDLDEAFTAKVRHEPVANAQCSSCHNPHAARMDALLRQRPAMLCVKCHESITQAMSRDHVHQPVAQGKCSSCHDAHGSDHDGLLVDSGIQVCSSCHPDIGEWTQRDYQHSPFQRGNCSTCHDPHAGNFPGLARGPEMRICRSCHSSSSEFRTAHGGFAMENAECHQCHDPHSSTRDGLFHAYLHAPFENGSCAACHRGADDAISAKVITGQSKLCGQCHPDQVTESRNAAFAHVSVTGGNCTSCHNPHMGPQASMLKGNQASVCMTCHDPGGGKSGDEGRFVTHADLDCSSCHDPHGGQRPLMFAQTVINMCNECHGHEHTASHPMGAGLLDPRNDRELDCLSCHGIHDSPASSLLHASGEGEVCIGCHKEVNF